MTYTKILGVAAAAAAMALMAFASTASATTLEVGGVAKNETVTIKASLATGTSALLSSTASVLANTCKASSVEGNTVSPFTGATVGGPITSLTFTECKENPVVVDKAGSLSVGWNSGTTNGTVSSNGAEVTVPSPLGLLNCKTTNTPIGTATGVKEGSATVDVNAVLNCGILLPSAKWEATYTVTSPAGLGVRE